MIFRLQNLLLLLFGVLYVVTLVIHDLHMTNANTFLLLCEEEIVSYVQYLQNIYLRKYSQKHFIIKFILLFFWNIRCWKIDRHIPQP